MHDMWLINQLGDEILRGRFTVNALLAKLGPESTRDEFTDVLIYHLNHDACAVRDPITYELILEETNVFPDSCPDGWYTYEQRSREFGTVIFFIPPIPDAVIRELILEQIVQGEPLEIVVARTIASFPELCVFGEEWVAAHIIAPCLYSVLSSVNTSYPEA